MPIELADFGLTDALKPHPLTAERRKARYNAPGPGSYKVKEIEPSLTSKFKLEHGAHFGRSRASRFDSRGAGVFLLPFPPKIKHLGISSHERPRADLRRPSRRHESRVPGPGLYRINASVGLQVSSRMTTRSPGPASTAAGAPSEAAEAPASLPG